MSSVFINSWRDEATEILVYNPAASYPVLGCNLVQPCGSAY